jgi:hypothetical protein
MINHKVFITEWGGTTHDHLIKRYDPSASTGITNETNVEPSTGVMIDLEGNLFDIDYVQKFNGCIWSGGVRGLVEGTQKDAAGYPPRIHRLDMDDPSNNDKWVILKQNDADKFYPNGICRAIDITNKLFLPVRAISAYPTTL